MIARIAGIALVAGLVAHSAWASEGGPDVFVPLGYDARLERAYWQIEGWNESGAAPRVEYFDLRSARPGRAIVLEWSRDATGDSTYRRRLVTLRKRLRPFRESYGPQLMPHPRVDVDSVRTRDGWKLARFHVRTGPRGATQEIRVTTYGDPTVVIARDLAIPGRPERILVLAFRGVPWEEIYESQVPVLWREGLPPEPVDGGHGIP